MTEATRFAATRRGFLQTGAAAAALGLTGLKPSASRAAGFPERTMQVYIPTRAGGGADRNFRAFGGVWSKHLGAEMEPSFYPGAAGRVGYETYMAKAADDCHDLIFGNMGPEVLNWVVKKPTFSLDDYFYFVQVDADPGSIFLRDDSPMKTVDDVIAEGKKRTLTVATSRLAHPASLGMLVLARKTGMSVNLIPLSGGKNTRNGVLTGETDLGVLPATTVMGRKNITVAGLFDEKNKVPDRIPDAVLINTQYDLGIPPLAAGVRAFGIKKAAADKYPDRYAKLLETAKPVFEDPAYKEAVAKAKAPWELISPGYEAECKAYVQAITEVGQEYRDLLTGG
ncbi:MAG: tripartite tricarboxylate transporter substrate-binding protein [Paracoccaceae bacterium]